MKPVWIFCFILILLVPFQNCGNLSERALFSDASHNPNPGGECESLECFRSSDLLWLQIREFEPYKLKRSNIETYFTVGGYCGVGGFSNHRFYWSVKENFGAEQLIGRGSVDDLCDTGRFQVPIIANIESNFEMDRQYEVTLELVGIENGVAVGNRSPYALGRTSVLILPPDGI